MKAIMLKDQLLNIFNVAAILAIIVFGAFILLFERDQIAWAVLLIILAVLLILYMNSRKRLIQYIEERKKPLNKPENIKAEQRLSIVNGIAIIAILIVAVFTWVFMNAQLSWGIILIILILLLAGLINLRKLISDIR